MIPSPCLLCLQ